MATAPSRFPILTFTVVGLLLLLTSDAVVRGLMKQARGPHKHVAGILAEVWNWTGPALWLLAIALCFWLISGSAAPTWTKGNWPLAGAVLYLFHLPLMLFLPLAIFGRWGFAFYLFLATVGAVLTLRLLLGSFHIAAFFLLAEPVVRSILWGHLHHAMRSVVLTLLSVIGFPLIGWWFRDAARLAGVESGKQK